MEEIKILPVLYDFILWYSPKISGYSRKYKYTLGDRITSLMLDILEFIIEAKYGAKKKAHFLRRTNLSLEKLRFLVRLSKDLQCISLKEYEYASQKINEIGRMVGSWEKHSKAREDGETV